MMTHAHPRPWRGDSLFTAGKRRPLCREARRIWCARLEAARRAGHVTALHAEIGRAMLRRLGVEGRLDPSQDTIAADAACSARTVRRALARLAALGLLAWQRRLVRAGWRTEQTSNAYELVPDGRPVPPRPARPASGGQGVRETRLISISTADRVEAMKALEAVRAALSLEWVARSRGAVVA
jgi:hypothetical protein